MRHGKPLTRLKKLQQILYLQSFKMRPVSLLAAAGCVVGVYGHGGIYNYTIDGVDYPG
jgi:hypothetical protein